MRHDDTLRPRSYGPSPRQNSTWAVPDDVVTGWSWRQRLSRTAAETIQISGPLSTQVRSPKMARLEAALFVAESALSAKKLSQIAVLADVRETLSLLDQLNAYYDQNRSAFRIEQVAAGYRLLTRSELSAWLDRVHERQSRMKLSSPMLETLAIVAYRQPCTRADVEAIRGVQSAELIKQLMERNLVRVCGEDDSLGRPYLYGTTRLFLETFGLTDLKDLPLADRLRRIVESKTTDSAKGDESEEAA